MGSESSVRAELDAVHQRARKAYLERDLATYLGTFHPDLEYRQLDGRSIGREQLGRDLRKQLDRVHAAATEFRRDRLEISAEGLSAIEEGEQHARFEVRAFAVVHRAWNLRRRGRYEWVRSTAGWQIRRVQVLLEETTSRVWLSLGRNTPAA
jgi:hypothetical protein